MRLTRSYPEIENLDILEKFYKTNQPAMFVANHCSWMDIPYVGATMGWRNYKLVSKVELGIIPILGTAIRVAGNLMVDRTNRKSGIKTLKQGINYLKVRKEYSGFVRVIVCSDPKTFSLIFQLFHNRMASNFAPSQREHGQRRDE
jgi:1-acyl-sn-glycerol-3-phosphate acyltransferase